jgi:hypothetical protein
MASTFDTAGLPARCRDLLRVQLSNRRGRSVRGRRHLRVCFLGGSRPNAQASVVDWQGQQRPVHYKRYPLKNSYGPKRGRHTFSPRAPRRRSWARRRMAFENRRRGKGRRMLFGVHECPESTPKRPATTNRLGDCQPAARRCSQQS